MKGLRAILSCCSALVLFHGFLGCREGTGIPDSQDLTLQVYLSQESDTGDAFAQMRDSDTVAPGDTIIMHGRVLPSAVDCREYWWTVESVRRPSWEFTFEMAWNTGGWKHCVFHAVDRFSDTISDTLYVYVDARPVLDSLLLPRNEASGLLASSTEPLWFRWEGHDSLESTPLSWKLQILSSDDSMAVLDTILSKTEFACRDCILPLENYLWRVIVSDAATNSDTSAWQTFSTGSMDNSARLQGQWLIPWSRTSTMAGFCVAMSDRDTLHTTISESGAFDFSAVPAGTYRITSSGFFMPGLWFPDTLVTLSAGTIRDIRIPAKDTSKPSFTMLPSPNDTVHADSFSVTIRIQELGSGINHDSTAFQIRGGEYTPLLAWSGDSLATLHYPGHLLPGTATLSFHIQDRAGNTRDSSWNLVVVP